jgi:hypothetical protein
MVVAVLVVVPALLVSLSDSKKDMETNVQRALKIMLAPLIRLMEEKKYKVLVVRKNLEEMPVVAFDLVEREPTAVLMEKMEITPDLAFDHMPSSM